MYGLVLLCFKIFALCNIATSFYHGYRAPMTRTQVKRPISLSTEPFTKSIADYDLLLKENAKQFFKGVAYVVSVCAVGYTALERYTNTKDNINKVVGYERRIVSPDDIKNMNTPTTARISDLEAEHAYITYPRT
jgi:hypothetical protein